MHIEHDFYESALKSIFLAKPPQSTIVPSDNSRNILQRELLVWGVNLTSFVDFFK